MRGRDLGWLLLLLAFAASKPSRAARAPSSAPTPEGEPDYNMSPEEQAERLPISDGWATLQRGRAYRLAGDLESPSPIDPSQVRALLIVAGARDVAVGERPPHAAAFTLTAPAEFRVRLGERLPFQLGGVTLRLRSVRALPGSSVVVGKRRR